MNLPEQRKTYAEKKKNDFKLVTDTAEHYFSRSSFSNELIDLYKYFGDINYLNLSKYKHVLNPTGQPTITDIEKDTRIPLKNWSIIMPVVNMYVGEWRKRPKASTVVCINDDAYERRENARREFIASKAAEKLAAEVAKEIPHGAPTEQTAPGHELEGEFEKVYVDPRATVGQKALNIIKQENDTDEIAVLEFLDYIIAGWGITYKYIEGGDVEEEVVPPPYFWYVRSPNIPYIEDTEAQVRKIPTLTAQQIVDRYPTLKPEHRRRLIGETSTGGKEPHRMTSSVHDGNGSDISTGSDSAGITSQHYNITSYDIHHIVFRSQMKIGIRHYQDALGEWQKDEVDEYYKVDDSTGEWVDWKWRPQLWETTRIMEGVYVETQPLDIQRAKFNGLDPKSCYNGIAYFDRFVANTSVVKLGIPFQEKVNEYHHKIDELTLTDKGSIMLMDINAIPKSSGFTRDDWMYFLQRHKVAFIDRSNSKVDKGMNQYHVMNMTQTQYIMNNFQLITAWKNAYMELVGITPQRLGATTASEGKATMEYAMGQSYTMSEEMFAKFQKLRQRDEQGLLDYSKYAWKDNGKQGQFKNPATGKDEYAYIDGIEYPEMEHGLAVVNSGEEQANLDAFKQLLLPMIQNSGEMPMQPDLISKMLRSKSMSIIEELTAEHFKLAAKNAAEQQQAAQQAELAKEQEVTAREDKKIASNEKIAAAKNETEIYIAELEAKAEIMKGDNPDEEQDVTMIDEVIRDYQDGRDKADNARIANSLKALDIAEKSRLKELEIQRDYDNMDNDLAIADKNMRNRGSK